MGIIFTGVLLLLIFLRYAELIGQGSETIIASIVNDLKFVGRVALSIILGATVISIFCAILGQDVSDFTIFQLWFGLITGTFTAYQCTQALFPSTNRKLKVQERVEDAEKTIEKWRNKK